MISSVATTAPTRVLDIAGTGFAYRRFGTPAGTPLVFTQHFMGNLDNFDPAISDALAALHRPDLASAGSDSRKDAAKVSPEGATHRRSTCGGEAWRSIPAG